MAGRGGPCCRPLSDHTVSHDHWAPSVDKQPVHTFIVLVVDSYLTTEDHAAFGNVLLKKQPVHTFIVLKQTTGAYFHCATGRACCSLLSDHRESCGL